MSARVVVDNAAAPHRAPLAALLEAFPWATTYETYEGRLVAQVDEDHVELLADILDELRPVVRERTSRLYRAVAHNLRNGVH